jgi:insulysin
MTVNAGFDKEDAEINGLAHFCEHMLFLGSHKYTKPSYFVDQVTLHNGKFNGYTDYTNSGFFFKINTDHFDQSLETFARFFIDPLMSKEFVAKEVNAVDSEFQKNIALDDKRKEMIYRELADKGSVYSRFSTGNNDTLLRYTETHGIDLRERLLEFHRKNYRPDNMKLIIYGEKEPEYYFDKVKAYFTDMQEVNSPYENSANVKPPWEKFKTGKLVFYKTITQHQELEISFLIDDLYDLLPDNPALYYKTILNYKGENSLTDHLRKVGYAAGIYAYAKRVYKGTCFFKLKAFITTKGIENIDDVILTIFKYINLVKVKGLDTELYHYVRKMLKFEFYHEPKKSTVMKTLKEMTSVVLNYQDKYFLAQHDLLYEYNEDVLRDFGRNFVLNNAIIMIGNKEFSDINSGIYKEKGFMVGFDHSKVTEKLAKYYDAAYGGFDFTTEFVSRVNGSMLEEAHVDLFPLKYELPTNISLTKECNGDSKCIDLYKSDDKDLSPKVLDKGDNFLLLYKLDRTYLIAKTNLFLRYIYETNVNDIVYATKLRLLIYIINHYLSNFFNAEGLRHTSFEIKANINGFSIKIFSFTETLPDTVKEMTDKLFSLSLSEEEFNLTKDEMKSQFEAQLNLDPFTTGYVNFFKLILKDYIKNSQILEELEKLTRDDFFDFYNSLHEKVYIKAFIHGTLDENKAIGLFKSIKDSVAESQQLNPKAIHYLNQHADLSGYYIYREQLKDEHNVNHAVLNFYQIGPENIENLFTALLIKSLVGYIYFTELRMKEQLGYAAKGKVFSEGNIVYFLIYIQGNSKQPDYMDYRIENVITLMRERLEQASEEDLQKAKMTIISTAAKKDMNLRARSLRLWDEIVTGRGYFDIEKIYKHNAKNMTKELILKKFDEVFDKKLSKLSIQEYNNKKIEHCEEPKDIHGVTPVVLKDEDVLRNGKKFMNLSIK